MSLTTKLWHATRLRMARRSVSSGVAAQTHPVWFRPASTAISSPPPHWHDAAITTTTTTTTRRSMSSFSPVQWWQDRQENKQAEKYKERVRQMAHQETWTLQDLKSELDEVVNSWMSKVPGLGNNKETEMAKKLHQVLSGLVSIVGTDATLERVEAMTKLEKLQAAAAAQTTVQEMNQLIQQFSTTTIMHKVLRSRHLAGKTLPETAEATQAMVQAEAGKHVTRTQRQKMVKASTQAMRKTVKRR